MEAKRWGFEPAELERARERKLRPVTPQRREVPAYPCSNRQR